MRARRKAIVWIASALVGCEVAPPVVPPIPPVDSDRIAWHVTQYAGQGTPGSTGELVYFSAQDHNVVAVNQLSGEIEWITKLPVNLERYYGTGLVVTGGAVVVGDLDVFGLDPVNGEILWRFAPEGVDRPGLILPGPAGENVIVTSSSGHLFSLVARTGEVNWMTRIGTIDDLRIFRPTVRDSDVFISFTEGLVLGTQKGGVARISLDDGVIRWWRYLPPPSDSLRQSFTIEPALAGDILAAGSRDGPTFGFRTSDGELVWTLPIAPELLTPQGPPSQELAPLASDGRIIYVGSSQGRLRAVNAATGSIVWERPPGFGGIRWLAADSVHVVVVYPLGDIQIISADNGELVAHVAKENFSVIMTPLLTSDMVFASGLYGLYAVKR